MEIYITLDAGDWATGTRDFIEAAISVNLPSTSTRPNRYVDRVVVFVNLVRT